MNRIKPNPSPTPKWSDKPLLKSYQKSKPPLGWPRATDSLCPKCVPEIRQQILDGHLPHEVLINEKVGEIKATIVEMDGKIMMVKECPKHGRFEDLMSIDTEFSKHLEDVFPGRDIRAHNDEKLHKHGSSTVKYGRGSVLTIDLTNRCNMMCDPCFMDANQVGFVHELQWEEIKQMLDNAITIKPRRQMSVQFSGGEPTLSPYFLDAVRYARKVGYNSVQAATNGIEFAKSFEFAQQAAEAGLRYAYLQFDGIGNAANAHRKVGNLFDVKLKAIDNLHRAGVEIVPVVTIVNGINNEQDRLPVIPAGKLHRTRRSYHRRSPQSAALHALSSRPRREGTNRPRRACSRLVPHFVHVYLQRLGRPDARQRPQKRLGPTKLRLPSQLRYGHGGDDRQRNEGSGAGYGVPAWRPTGEGHCQGQRCLAGKIPDGIWDGVVPDEELQPVQIADAFQDDGPALEVRQELQRDRKELWQGWPRPQH
jgi:pyruvate-formate lyase-activating enzyme